MSNSTNIGRKIQSFEISEQFDGYSKVVITVSEDVEYVSGADTGRTLTLFCPWGTQEMADNILSKIRGFQYQPYTATNALLDPSAELGDGVTVNNTYSGIYTNHIKFGRKLRATISAPEDEGVQHEFPYVAKSERKITRTLYSLTTELKVQAGLISAEVSERKSDVESINSKLTVQAGEIAAKVSKSGGDASSFGWTLDEASWTLHANGSEVLKATKSGVEITGKITATSGKIGGFAIESNYLSYNNQTWGGTNSTGIYLGPSGIQLGKNFKVDAAGNLSAASGTFSGYVKAGNIQYGGSNGTLSGSALTGNSIYGNKLAYNTVSTAYTSGGINTSLGYADFANGVFNGWNTAANGAFQNLSVNAQILFLGGSRVRKATRQTSDGTWYNYLTWT